MELKQKIYAKTHKILLKTLDKDIFTKIDDLDDFFLVIAGGYAIKHYNSDYNTRDVDIEIFAKPRSRRDINKLMDEIYEEHLRKNLNKAQIKRAIGDIGVKIIDINYNKSTRSNTISINVMYERPGGALISQSIIDIYFSNETTELHRNINVALGRQRRRAVPVYKEFPPYSILKVLTKEWLINEKEIAIEDINTVNKLGAKHKEKSWVNQLIALKPDSDVLKKYYPHGNVVDKVDTGFKFRRNAATFAPQLGTPIRVKVAPPGSDSSDEEWHETVTSFSGTSGSDAGYDGDDDAHPDTAIANEPTTPKRRKRRNKGQKKKKQKKTKKRNKESTQRRKKRKSRRKGTKRTKNKY